MDEDNTTGTNPVLYPILQLDVTSVAQVCTITMI